MTGGGNSHVKDARGRLGIAVKGKTNKRGIDKSWNRGWERIKLEGRAAK